MKGLTDFLTGMSGANAILLGIILGAMMCFDLGGPANKVAYVFGTGLLASNPNVPSLPMAAVMAAGMVPAIGMGIATFVARNKFIDSEREAGKASFVLGLCFISEGAIPFAARDPMRNSINYGRWCTGWCSVNAVRLWSDGTTWWSVRTVNSRRNQQCSDVYRCNRCGFCSDWSDVRNYQTISGSTNCLIVSSQME